MKNIFLCKFVKRVVIPSLVLSCSMSALASGHHHSHPAVTHVTKNHLSQTLSTDVQKSQFSFISKKLSERKLPKELALIPVIESNYNTHAKSNKGAGGLWQLMPQTAKENGISADERFHLGPSTVAALNYFSKLHQKFGNWEFAIAAYNAGSGRVQKALSKNPTATSVKQLHLPQETKQYVQKFYQMQGELRSYPA